MRWLLVLILVGCSAGTADDLADAGPDASTVPDGGYNFLIYERDDSGILRLINYRDADVWLPSKLGTDDAGIDPGDAGDATATDTGPAGLMLGLCELCETDADCATGVCAVANSTGEGATRCLPDCSTDQEIACGDPFGWRNDGQDPGDRLWLCYDHGACGPLNNECSLRLVFAGSGTCVKTDYCEGWLEGT